MSNISRANILWHKLGPNSPKSRPKEEIIEERHQIYWNICFSRIEL